MGQFLKGIRLKRWVVMGSVVGAALCYVFAFYLPMWGFYLYAPQYPDGLTLSIYLNRVGGDVDEINTLNHYIGMANLNEAAQLEKALAGYGITLLGFISIAMVFLPGKRWARLFALPGIVFPLFFLAAVYRWMHTFGHNLSPDAPVTMAPFTPTLLGIGKIGNFHTEGLPGAGFYLILLSAILVGIAFWTRHNACANCPNGKKCGAMCPVLLFKKDAPAH